MTTELEQEFYDTFKIELRCHNPIVYLSGDKKCKGVCQNCQLYNYPKITDHKFLQMICILNSIYDCGFKNNTSLASKEVKYLKMEILKHCILHKEQIKTQIQQLFKD